MSSTSAAARASSSPGRGHDRGRHDPRTRAGAGPEPFDGQPSREPGHPRHVHAVRGVRSEQFHPLGAPA
ncbi:hypothetical protein, partial [Nocardiopsis alba]|uniref:hypothetical protein n=1 Tax=Nocardiopsis alba TaxID=53437 RepID=UPI003F4CEDB5